MEDLLNARADPVVLRAVREPVGRSLVAAGLITEQQLAAALEIQRECGSPLGRILMAKGWVRPFDFYRHLAEHLGLPFVNLVKDPPDGELFDQSRYGDYAARLYVPWKRTDAGLALALAEPDEELLRRLRGQYGPGVSFVLTSRLDILWTVQRMADRQLELNSVLGRAQKDPEHSATQVLTRAQGAAAAVVFAAAAACLFWNPVATLSAANALVGVLLLGSLLLRILLVWTGSGTLYQSRTSRQELESLDPRTLPVYTILVP
ncbi:MAG: hypothetical protein WHT08_05360, partial [Bryobacteraceae bacterium]